MASQKASSPRDKKGRGVGSRSATSLLILLMAMAFLVKGLKPVIRTMVAREMKAYCDRMANALVG